MRKLALLAIVGLLATGGAALAAEEDTVQQVAPADLAPKFVISTDGAPVFSDGGIEFGVGLLESMIPGAADTQGPLFPLGGRG